MLTKSATCGLAAAALSWLAPTVLHAQPPFAGVGLRVSREVAPPGGIAQIKVTFTEPKPISTGRMLFNFAGFDSFVGIALMSPANDTFGVAEVRGSQIRFAVRSTTGSFGTDPAYPILTIAAWVPATAPLGSAMPVTTADDAISLLGPDGAVYPTVIEDGWIMVERGISIDDVMPGSADLPAASVVTIVGRGFVPGTKVQFSDDLLSEVRFVDGTHMQVVLASAARMHGRRVRAQDPDGSKTTYFSYQRTSREGTSGFPTLENSVPLFPLRLVTSACVDIPGVSTALAVQNIGDAIAPVAVDLLAPNGQVLATTVTTVDPNRFKVSEISELFGIDYVASSSVCVRSAVPIQVMGIQVDPSGDTTPIAPR
jgi:hypothetical protein